MLSDRVDLPLKNQPGDDTEVELETTKTEAVNDRDTSSSDTDEKETKDTHDELVKIDEVKEEGLTPSLSDEADSSSISSADKDEITPKLEVKFTLVQRIGQEIIKFEMTGTPTYLFKSVLKIPAPMVGMLEAASYPMNAIVGDMLLALTTKEDPFSGWRASGDGNAAIGFLKNATSSVIAVGLVTMVGYGSHTVLTVCTPSLLLSESENMKSLGKILSEEAYRAPLFGALSYVNAKFIKAIGMKLWDCCIPSKEEEIVENPNLHVVQIGAQYVIRLFGDFAVTETILYYLNVAGQKEIASDPRIQMLLFLGPDGVNLLAQYLCFYVNPIRSIFERENQQSKGQYDDSNDSLSNISPPSSCQLLGKATWRALGQLAILGVAYGLSEMTCTMAESLGSSLCTENNLANRVTRFSTALGIPLAIEYVGSYVAPKVASAVSNCWSSLFSKSRMPEEYKLLSDIADIDDEDSSDEERSLLRRHSL